jgi:hypothetical protein
MNPQLVKLVAGGDVIYLIQNQDLYLKVQPALGGYYEEELTPSEYQQIKKNYTVKKKIPLGLFTGSTDISESVKRQLGLEDFD